MTTLGALIILAAVLTAAAALTVAWQTVQTERRRSDARVAALMASLSSEWFAPGPGEPALVPGQGPTVIADADPVLVVTRDPAPIASADDDTRVLPAPGSAAATAPLGAGGALFGTGASLEETSTRGVPRFVVLALGACLMVGIASALSLALRSPTPAAAAQAPASLELVSLAHARQGERLTISGLVRNPREAPAIDAINGVVLFFDASGGFLTSARAPLDFRRLGPGEESPFTIAVEAPAGLARYRVSFRRDTGGLVPHVDRRAERITP